VINNPWDKNFQRDEYIYGKEANAFIKEKGHVFPDRAKIACLAEGEGRNAVFLAGLGHQVKAYDQSQVGLDKTKKLAKEKGVSVQTERMDLTVEEVPREAYDGATLVFGHVPGEKQAFLFQNLFQAVKSGGYILFEVYSKRQINYGTGGPGVATSLYAAEDLLALSEEHEVLHFYYGEAERYEGINHTGPCHLIQALIKKV